MEKQKENKEIKLTPKQELFSQKYIELGNATAAYKIAYNCENMKIMSINRKAKELIDNVNISARIKQLQNKLSEKHDISKERILKELECILNADIKDYVHFDGDELKFKSFDDLTEAQTKAIESIKMGRNGLELKLHGKNWTVERICKMLGYDAPIRMENKIVDVCIEDGTEDD